MALIEINNNPSPDQLRMFGVLLALFFALTGTLIWIRWGLPSAAYALWAAGGTITLLYWIIPALRRPFYLGWMYAAFPVGWTISHLLMVIIYYGVLTPTGLAMRLFRYDPMKKWFEPNGSTYWTEHRSADEPDRYLRQF